MARVFASGNCHVVSWKASLLSAELIGEGANDTETEMQYQEKPSSASPARCGNATASMRLVDFDFATSSHSASAAPNTNAPPGPRHSHIRDARHQYSPASLSALRPSSGDI